MRQEGLEDRVRQLHQAAERISANLVELEIDSSRQLLEASALTGESAASWSAASDTLTELWRRHGLLEALLQRADKLRGFRRTDQLASLLDGPSIELGSATVPLAQRRLAGSDQVTERCSPEQLIAAMSTSFDQVKGVVFEIGSAWDSLIPKIDRGRRLVQETRALAERVPGVVVRELEAMQAELERLSEAVTADPLSVQTDEVESLLGAIQAARDELEENAAFQRGFEARILAARELLEQLRTAQQEARAAREELLVKVEAPGVPPPLEQSDDLEGDLSRTAELASGAAWKNARQALENWTASANQQLEVTRQSVAACRAPIEARNQFRALLEAYRVKAKRLGKLEDPGLADISARAQEVLYTAPTNLALAAQLVRSYQQALGGAEQTSEVLR